MERCGCVFLILSGALAVFIVIIACTCYSGARDAAVFSPRQESISAEQFGLLDAVSEECKNLDEFIKTQSWNDSVPRMIVDDERQLLFCAIPKVGTISLVKCVLGRSYGIDLYILLCIFFLNKNRKPCSTVHNSICVLRVKSESSKIYLLAQISQPHIFPRIVN